MMLVFLLPVMAFSQELTADTPAVEPSILTQVVISDIERISASEVQFTITNSTGDSRSGCVVVTGHGGAI
jgi:hypothetical protein